MEEGVLFLKEIPLFRELAADLDQVSLKTIQESLYRGDILFSQGDKAEGIYLIQWGSFKLTQYTEGGSENILRIAGPGDILGVTFFFQAAEHQASAIALEDSLISIFNGHQFEDLLSIYPEISLKIIQGLSKRLEEVTNQLSEVKILSVPQRLISLFLRLAKEYGESMDEGTRIYIRLTQQEIANLIGASRVMVNQAISCLKEKGYLKQDQRHYILLKNCPQHFSWMTK